ncbi:hypothetical protein KSF_088100 [Reticulibacter mediterranei]|uniref:Uncharacterized protein n=1 Tax=Reticulibacter mediterranei TaxID=2778369 RepID=A0A8J3N8Z8_9CHLR|nr:hypothetical protein [Reticulibacter mediterranei]GHO98762.1 hypothetical protein KSF_088100 [Reticulibacter mediterranei]
MEEYIPNLPEDFDVTEVTEISDEETDETIYAGEVETWQQREFLEKAKIRPYLTILFISIWIIAIVVSAIKMYITGNLTLIIPPALFTAPVYIILKFYFKGG